MKSAVRDLKVKVLFFILISLGFSLFSESFANEICATSAVVVDAQTGSILYGKNPNLKLPPASTTKLITAMVALDNLTPDTKVKISEKASKTMSVSPKLYSGEIYTVHDLIYLALMRSVNSAAVALAEAVAGSEAEFTDLMNKKAKKIGAVNTKFANASGLPGDEQYTTVYDLTKIMSHSLNYPLIKQAINTRVYIVRSDNGKEHFIQNTNQLLWTEDGMIGGKTGYTRSAKHCFVSATSMENRLIYTAILGGSKREELWNDTQNLLSKASLILSGKSDPIVHYTNDKPILKASYIQKGNIQNVALKSKNKDKSKSISKKRLNKKFAQQRMKNAKTNKSSI